MTPNILINCLEDNTLTDIQLTCINEIIRSCELSKVYLLVNSRFIGYEKVDKACTIICESFTTDTFSSLLETYISSGSHSVSTNAAVSNHSTMDNLLNVVKAYDLKHILITSSQFVFFVDPARYLEEVSQRCSVCILKDENGGQPLLIYSQDHDQLLLYERSKSNCLKLFPSLAPFPMPKNCDDFKSSPIVEIQGFFDIYLDTRYDHLVNLPYNCIYHEPEPLDLLNPRPSTIEISWDCIDGNRRPYMISGSSRTPILGSKIQNIRNLRFSPFAHRLPESELGIITGERVQNECDLTIASDEILDFHGRHRIKTPSVFTTRRDTGGLFFRPSNKDLLNIDSHRSIFIYGHFLWYFKVAIFPHLQNQHILVIHNSDVTISYSDIMLLEDTRILEVHAFGSQISHPKLKHIPAGIGNSQWPHGDTGELYNQSRSIIKRKSIYANFNLTHQSRVELLNIIRSRADITYSQGLDYRAYLEELKEHRYCLCPRGNNIDSHRFWECQYLDVIPIILESDWLASYAGYKFVPIPSWDKIPRL
jgi:hypothetical protein